jgi:signal transduction histidine kinase
VKAIAARSGPPNDREAMNAVEVSTEPLWRAVAVFRVAAFSYVVVAYVMLGQYFEHPLAGWVAIGAMGAWTVAVTLLYRAPAGRHWPVVVMDVVVACAAILVTPVVDDPTRIDAGEPTLALVWPAAAVLASAVRWGLPGGLGAAIATSAASLSARGEFAWPTARNVVLLVVTGAVVGYAAGLFRRSQLVLVQALRVEASTRERDRLARSVHDGVLQALALVQRTAGDLGGDGPALARLAGEQEVALRALVSQPVGPTQVGVVDVGSLIAPLASSTVTVSRPAGAVLLREGVAQELVAAAKAALENARLHAGAGAHVWILLEEEQDRVTLTIRDDGVGMEADRLARAADDGRLGMSSSIIGRMKDVGGDAVITSFPGEGTEIELHVPTPA